ncbi:glycoside hydrolase family 36 protein [Nocardioides sp. GY 10127]|uniref:glycoside hydrolase family 36 protein n=1 Tax=Nocardioides sp. GY 10127 TaxID=2569762 RepID=UPI0010A77A28|nr:glycoside hydrolase family 36 protein [Nocardioides sp. GY 10127]TIC79107.1 alpha-galactosidase [Nocardioides sp. GY 10127]
METVEIGNARLRLELAFDADTPAALAAVVLDGRRVELSHPVGLGQVLTAGSGHVPAADRLVGTAVGRRLRVVAVEPAPGSEQAAAPAQAAAGRVLVRQADAQHQLEVLTTLELHPTAAAFRASTRVVNVGPRPVVLRQVASFATAIGPAAEPGGVTADWQLLQGRNDWLGEGRWEQRSLDDLLPGLEEHLTGHDPRTGHSQRSTGTWSTGAALPFAYLSSQQAGLAWAWQVEHNGAWRWDVGQDTAGCWLALGGPTDRDAAWTHVLRPGGWFGAVPVSLALGADLDEAVAALTQQRRASRRPHPDNATPALVFNDYMNTLDGDPTTEKLLPLVDAAAEAGAEVFCIDAGWYDETGDWWDSVGEWAPSRTRFPGGLREVTDRIRDRGMVPGLWLEPEVVGVRSPVAERLPDDAFFTLHGQRVVEHDRYHLDLRHPAAVRHLDAVVDRLVEEFGVGYFKLDYNIDPGTGPDRGADSTGDALLEHNRAHLRWLDGVLERHPFLVLENCGSGAMRMDPAMLARVALQSTSDQQEPLLYPPIAVTAPLAMAPEQAASWAYPQPGMDPELAAFCLVTGLAGRFYLSGFLNRMSADEMALVGEAVDLAKRLRKELGHSRPVWPTGLPGWRDPWVSLAHVGPDGTTLHVWRRGGPREQTLHLPHLVGHELDLQTSFPVGLAAWDATWDPGSGTLVLVAPDVPVSARTFRIMSRAAGLGSDTSPSVHDVVVDENPGGTK